MKSARFCHREPNTYIVYSSCPWFLAVLVATEPEIAPVVVGMVGDNSHNALETRGTDMGDDLTCVVGPRELGLLGFQVEGDVDGVESTVVRIVAT